MKEIKAELFSYAISNLDFSSIETELNKEYIWKLRQLGGNAFFKFDDCIKLSLRMQKYFEELETEMIENVNINNRKFEGSYTDLSVIQMLKEKKQNEILNIKSAVESQFDTIALGIFLRAHALLEEILKTLCINIQSIYGLTESYKEIKRAIPYDKDIISTLEKCVLYIEKSPLDSKIDLNLYDYLVEWNTVRNILVHDAGVININKDNGFLGKLNLSTVNNKGGSITFDENMNKDEHLLENQPKIKLTFSNLISYIMNIDKFLAELIHGKVSKIFNQTNDLIINAMEQLSNPEFFEQQFDSIINEMGSNPKLLENLGINEVNEDFKEIMKTSIKGLLNNK